MCPIRLAMTRNFLVRGRERGCVAIMGCKLCLEFGPKLRQAIREHLKFPCRRAKIEQPFFNLAQLVRGDI